MQAIKEKTNYNKFCFLNEIPAFCLSHTALKRTAEHSNKPLLLLTIFRFLQSCYGPAPDRCIEMRNHLNLREIHYWQHPRLCTRMED